VGRVDPTRWGRAGSTRPTRPTDSAGTAPARSDIHVDAVRDDDHVPGPETVGCRSNQGPKVLYAGTRNHP
jgi:hypothetical protein